VGVNDLIKINNKMKFTKTIGGLKFLIKIYQQELESGYNGDYTVDTKYNQEAISEMASAVEILKNNED
tara:strand:+ start:109 stop:312 length:204 start_codon:yes stop_codon:yes gene_type:complete